MAVTYSKTSPYAATGKFGNFLDVMTYRSITKHPDDVVYAIDSVYQYRPDMLAYDLYGDSNLWWVFAMRNPNVIRDPIFDFYAGAVIYIPKKANLVTDLGI
jgi:alpha-L-fucosidase